MLTPAEAKSIIQQLGATGTPPEYGVTSFTVGLKPYLDVIKEEYLETFIKQGASAFKLVIGSYGGGKTHFLYLIRELAWQYNYITSYVALSPTECPFSKLELVYKSVVANLQYPGSKQIFYEKGIDPILRIWKERILHEYGEDRLDEYLYQLVGIESSSFNNAVKHAVTALHRGDITTYNMTVQWLKGEDIPREWRNKLSIQERLDKSTAPRLLRSLAQWVSSIGYSGLILLFDEAERAVSIATTKDRRVALDNLRQIVDECGNCRLPGVMIFYAIPDEHMLLDERLETYEALRQRLTGGLSKVNPSGVMINLEYMEMEPHEFLRRLGHKLADIYQLAYGVRFDPTQLDNIIQMVARSAYERRHLDIGYRRVFVKSIIRVFHIMRQHPEEVDSNVIDKIIMDELVTFEQQAIREAESQEY